jgi:hypothetical protein
MEVVPREGYRLLLLIGKLDFGWVEVGIEFTLNGQACSGCGVGDEIDDGLVRFQWSSAPAVGDPGEEPVFNLVPFAGAGWVMAKQRCPVLWRRLAGRVRISRARGGVR